MTPEMLYTVLYLYAVLSEVVLGNTNVIDEKAINFEDKGVDLYNMLKTREKG